MLIENKLYVSFLKIIIKFWGFISIIVLSLFGSCEKEYINQKIYAIHLKPINVPDSLLNDTANVYGYDSQYIRKYPCFQIDIKDSCHINFAEIKRRIFSWVNYPIDSSLKIWCNKKILRGGDTIKSNTNLLKYFSVIKRETESYKFFLSYILICDTRKNNLTFCDSFYTFTASIRTESNILLKDSCVFKYYPNK